MCRHRWVLSVVVALALTLASASHSQADERFRVERDGVSLSFKSWSGRHGKFYHLYVNDEGLDLNVDRSRKVLAILRNMLDGRGARWPKTDVYSDLRFSYDPEYAYPYHIGRRRLHDYTVRVWMSRAELEELIRKWEVAP